MFWRPFAGLRILICMIPVRLLVAACGPVSGRAWSMPPPMKGVVETRMDILTDGAGWALECSRQTFSLWYTASRGGVWKNVTPRMLRAEASPVRRTV